VAKTFILVHGAWHGAWCWHKLAPLLEAEGARVLAPDLPSMGADHSPAAGITLDTWAQTVVKQASRHPGCVLVGHSLGGAVISRAAELAAHDIQRLVYLSAYLLPSGATVADAARADADSLIAPNMIPVQRGLTCSVRPEVLREAFYGVCSEADFEFARTRFAPSPLRPLVSPLDISPGHFGRLPRAYIETTLDRAVTLAAQRRMREALPCEPVFTLEADHSAFLSQPDALARILISI
jgi:pimeloyl-ACP methyl ester carboxylesterase